MSSSFTRTLKLKLRPESYRWLNAAGMEVNQTFNFCNEASWLAITRTDRKRKWLSGFDLCSLTAGASQYFERSGADMIQRVCVEYILRCPDRPPRSWSASFNSLPSGSGRVRRSARSSTYASITT